MNARYAVLRHKCMYDVIGLPSSYTLSDAMYNLSCYIRRSLFCLPPSSVFYIYTDAGFAFAEYVYAPCIMFRIRPGNDLSLSNK